MIFLIRWLSSQLAATKSYLLVTHCVCVCVCVCLCVCMCAFVCVHAWAHVCVCVSECVCDSIFVCECVYVYSVQYKCSCGGRGSVEEKMMKRREKCNSKENNTKVLEW